jgi:hypothetical protein
MESGTIMTDSMNPPNRMPDTGLHPAARIAIMLAAVGFAIVTAPSNLASAIGLLSVRDAWDHAFAFGVLVLIAWASRAVAIQLRENHARLGALKSAVRAFDALGGEERRCMLDCLHSKKLRVARKYYDHVPRSLCDAGLLTAPGKESDDMLVTFRMDEDVATALRARVTWGDAVATMERVG